MTTATAETALPPDAFDQMSKLISIALKRKGDLEPGYYAVDGKRYRIDMPDHGKWRGWLFLKTGSDYKINMRILRRNPQGDLLGSQHAQEILATILADPLAAMKAYGDITGTCAVCGRKLECPVSVRFGIGPVCLNRMLAGF